MRQFGWNEFELLVFAARWTIVLAIIAFVGGGIGGLTVALLRTANGRVVFADQDLLVSVRRRTFDLSVEVARHAQVNRQIKLEHRPHPWLAIAVEQSAMLPDDAICHRQSQPDEPVVLPR